MTFKRTWYLATIATVVAATMILVLTTDKRTTPKPRYERPSLKIVWKDVVFPLPPSWDAKYYGSMMVLRSSDSPLGQIEFHKVVSPRSLSSTADRLIYSDSILQKGRSRYRVRSVGGENLRVFYGDDIDVKGELWAKGSGVLFLSNSIIRFDYQFPYESEVQKSVTMEALLITYWILADQSQTTIV